MKKGSLVPNIFSDGYSTALRNAIQDVINIEGAPCIGEQYCKDISNDSCGDLDCILYYDGEDEIAFKADPIQWLLDKEFITKGQALTLTLDLN